MAPDRTSALTGTADLALRAALWQVTLDASVLWPGVDRPSFDAAAAAIADVTASVLNGRGPHRLHRPAQVTPLALGVAALVSGMGPLLGYWIEQRRVVADAEATTVLGRHLEQGRRRFTRLARELTALLDVLGDRGIAATVLKGMHTGFRYFPEPGTRTIADIDILVPPDQLEATRRALRETGFREQRSTRRPFRSEWARPGTDIVHSLELDHAENPWCVDLHVELERSYFRGLRVRLDAPSPPAGAPFDLAGRPASGLAQPLLTAFLALHTSHGLDHLQLLRLVELVFVIRRDGASGALAWKDLARLLETSRALRFVYPALDLVEALAPGTVDGSLLARLRAEATPRQQRVVAAIRESGRLRLPRRSLDDKLMWTRGFPQLLRNVSELLWPSDQSLAETARLYGRRVAAALAGRLHIAAQPEPGRKANGADQPHAARDAE